MVSPRLREVEYEIDNHYRSNNLFRENSFGSAALHYLKVCEEQQIAALFNFTEMTEGQMEVIADTFRQLGVDLSGLPMPLKTAIQSQWEKHESIASSNQESLTAS